jgi:hypothetical protein
MKIQLPFNLIPHLEDTSIAACFGFRNSPDNKHTIIELSSRDAHDLLALLKGLETDLQIRCDRWRRHSSRSPIPTSRRSGLELNLQAVKQAVECIEVELSLPAG